MRLRKLKTENWKNEDSDQELLCNFCNGSGEGMHDGTTCSQCRGTGVY